MSSGCVQANLRLAYAIEEGMGYMEPPRQYQPTKHCLGYVLMRAGQNQTAAEVLTSCKLSICLHFLTCYLDPVWKHLLMGISDLC